MTLQLGNQGNDDTWMRRFLLTDAPALGYIALVFVLGSLRNLPQPHVANWDKLEHLVGFAVMQVVVARSLSGRLAPPRTRSLIAAAVVASTLGALLELFQTALPWRSADVRDWLADSVGAGLALVVTWALSRRRAVAVAETP